VRDLERAEIVAPYAGRVRGKDVDVGQFVTVGASVATIYAVDLAEVRLPLPDEELAFLDLPLSYRGSTNQPTPRVTLRATFAGETHEWEGRVVRTESEIDPVSRMVHVVAEVADPYAPGPNPNRPPLAVGMYVEAEIEGRTVSDVVYNSASLVIMALTGLVVGWRIDTSLLSAVAGFSLLLLFAYAFSWVMAFVGLIVPSVEVINNASFMVTMPLTFVANTFVPAENLPPVLRTFALWNPVSAVTQATRELFGNIPPGTPDPTAWPLQNPVLYTLIWAAAIIAVFAPLAVHRYRTSGRRS
jgi:hypothetical protein